MLLLALHPARCVGLAVLLPLVVLLAAARAAIYGAHTAVRAARCGVLAAPLPLVLLLALLPMALAVLLLALLASC